MLNIKIQQISITELDTDCIVNAANSSLRHGSGVCGAIFRAAGTGELQAACDSIGHCPTGSAVITPGFALRAKYIIHAVGPIWQGGADGEPELLRSAYQESLNRARENDCHSVGFPLISAGIFGCPKEIAWSIALEACRDWLMEHADDEMAVTFAIPDERILTIGKELLGLLQPEA